LRAGTWPGARGFSLASKENSTPGILKAARTSPYPQRLADGTTREGANSVAYAMFDSNATHMCFISMNPNRPRWKSEAAPTPEEGSSAIKGFGAYCGTVEIHAKEGFIVRNYEINQSPNAVGQVTKRWYKFEGANRMSLRIDPSELAAPVVENTLIWERVVK
jgi:hypothetical protein